jgi:hypothetical protein
VCHKFPLFNGLKNTVLFGIKDKKSKKSLAITAKKIEL